MKSIAIIVLSKLTDKTVMHICSINCHTQVEQDLVQTVNVHIQNSNAQCASDHMRPLSVKNMDIIKNWNMNLEDNTYVRDYIIMGFFAPNTPEKYIK